MPLKALIILRHPQNSIGILSINIFSCIKNIETIDDELLSEILERKSGSSEILKQESGSSEILKQKCGAVKYLNRSLAQ